MKELVYLTRQPFWGRAAGIWARAATLVRYLADHTRLRVVYLGPGRAVANDLRPRGLFVLPELAVAPSACASALRRFFTESRAEACIFSEIALAPLLEVVPKEIKLFLDTNDVVHEQARTFERLGLEPPNRMSEEEEYATFRRFDVVIAIQEREHASVARAVGAERALCVPHPPKLERRELRAEARSVGFVASAWQANRDALSWLTSEIWPRVAGPELTLDVYGGVSRHFQGELPGLRLHGLVPRLERIYDAVDVVVNPVRCGSGLKIKSVEALGAGLPLVTTSEGARGLERAAGRAFLVADGAEAFATALRRALGDRTERERLGREAFAFAQAELSPSVCFSGLLREIESPQRYLS